MKRFSPSERWTEVWHLGLHPDLKLAYAYIYDHCDPAGIWTPNWRDLNDEIGLPIGPERAIHELGDRVEVLKNGAWWVRSFIVEQYGRLSPRIEIHRTVLALIQANGITLPNDSVPVGPKPAKPPRPPKAAPPVEPVLPPPSEAPVLELERTEPTPDLPNGATLVRIGKKIPPRDSAPSGRSGFFTEKRTRSRSCTRRPGFS
jgi:hypothetical protein